MDGLRLAEFCQGQGKLQQIGRTTKNALRNCLVIGSAGVGIGYLVVAHPCGVTNRKARLRMAMDEAELASGRPASNLSNKLTSSAGLLWAGQMLAARSEGLTVQRRLARRRRLLEKYPWRRLLRPEEPRIHLLVLVHHLLDSESLFEVGAALFARQ
jgi:hypothetical protein